MQEMSKRSREKVYEVYRTYGPITDLHYIQPKKVELYYKFIRSATSARNCTYNLKIDNVKMVPHYENLIKPRHIVSWLSKHPRFFIPLILALCVAFLVSIFNPIRIYFIQTTTERDWYRRMMPKWLTLSKLLTRWEPIHKTTLEAVPEGGWQRLQNLKKNISLPPDSLVFITGPVGAGKSNLAGWMVPNSAPLLKIQCDTLIHQARSSMDVIRHVAKQIGYFPFFHSLDRYWGYLDTALSASLGARTGISVSDESSFQNILDCAAMALLKLSQKRKENEPYPVVILDHFLMQKHGFPSPQFYEQLALWAGQLVELGIAHVIVISNSNAETEVIRTLTPVLPTKSIDVITLRNMPDAQAKSFLIHHLPTLSKKDFEEVVTKLGGRTRDLEVFIQKISRMSVHEALEEMIHQAMIELYKRGCEKYGASFWSLLPNLPLPYAKVVNSVPCYTPEFFSTLESEGLLDILYHQGRPKTLQFPKPLYKTAYQRYVEEKELEIDMQMQWDQYLLKLEKQKLSPLVEEYVKLSSKTLQSSDGVQSRIFFLSKQIEASQKKIELLTEKLKKITSLENKKA
ncbi:mitochondrial escape protein 2 [Coelomomyces lativittatus]|nr:mitochondrial escape protein 2 [Coelomomyces lativittatus]